MVTYVPEDVGRCSWSEPQQPYQPEPGFQPLSQASVPLTAYEGMMTKEPAFFLAVPA